MPGGARRVFGGTFCLALSANPTIGGVCLSLDPDLILAMKRNLPTRYGMADPEPWSASTGLIFGCWKGRTRTLCAWTGCSPAPPPCERRRGEAASFF